MPLELMKSSIGCLLVPNKLLTTTPNVMFVGFDLLNLRLDIPTMVYIMPKAIYMILQPRFLPFQLLLDCHRHTYLPKH